VENQYPDQRGELIFLFYSRTSEDDIPVPEHEINTCHEWFL